MGRQKEDMELAGSEWEGERKTGSYQALSQNSQEDNGVSRQSANQSAKLTIYSQARHTYTLPHPHRHSLSLSYVVDWAQREIS